MKSSGDFFIWKFLELLYILRRVENLTPPNRPSFYCLLTQKKKPDIKKPDTEMVSGLIVSGFVLTY